MKDRDRTRAIILLAILIAIGGIVMYGQKIPYHPKETSALYAPVR